MAVRRVERGRLSVFAALEAGDPRQVGRYRIVARLGAGGMGQVFLGRSPGGRSVAVKVVRAELAQDAGFRKRFAREVATARRVTGFFTAGVVDADPDGSPAWLATEYVPGMALGEAVEAHGPWPGRSVLALGAGLAEALEAIHAAGVVHRDLKPSNVLLAPDGPRVIDFGISVAAEGSVLTQTGMVIGTPGFMSPEQLVGSGQVGPASDVFAFGAVLAYAAVGTGPFGGGAAHALNYRVVHEQPDLRGLPPEVRDVVARCLAKEPGRRPTVTALMTELAHAPGDDNGWLPAPVLEALRSRSGTGASAPAPAIGPGGDASAAAAPQPAAPMRGPGPDSEGPAIRGDAPPTTPAAGSPARPPPRRRLLPQPTASGRVAPTPPDARATPRRRRRAGAGADAAEDPGDAAARQAASPGVPTASGDQAVARPGTQESARRPGARTPTPRPHIVHDRDIGALTTAPTPPPPSSAPTRRRALTALAGLAVAGAAFTAYRMSDAADRSPQAPSANGAGTGARENGRPAPGTELWVRTDFPAMTAASYSSPAKALLIGGAAGVHAVDPLTGDDLWTFTTDAARPTAPVLDAAGGTAYFAGGDGTVHGLDIAARTVDWTYRMGGRGSRAVVPSDPERNRSTLYLTGSDSKLHAVSTATGVLRWTAPCPAQRWRSRVRPVASLRQVHVGGADGRIHTFDDSGEPLWTYDTGRPVQTTPALGGGVLCVGSLRREVLALEPSTGRKLWSFATQEEPGAPVVDGSTVYVHDYGGALHALDTSSGEPRWSYRLGSAVVADPLVDRGAVYVGAKDGTLHVLDAKSGKARWSVRADAEIVTAPRVFGAAVYFGVKGSEPGQGRLYAVSV
ncbi:PQQ-binding-like beta-propeller repeat protein [Streptomyces sp. CC228A]|uniref:outer membrane protein assembly factor BamB family protein n=1 Tax=Streptomyces sp. CC228A TaxID=2898186 RepID=UPI0027E42064|nr:PQQ-binding-like beta-propeller repeat protein [Streptomyces sp. CC228A]